MNKIILFLVLLLSGFAQAQIINIPDANFKSVLLSATTDNGIARDIDQNYIVIDTNNNNEIEVSEAANVYHLLLGMANIASLSGIENFANLQTLDCSSNNIASLNVAGMTSLLDLICGSNQLTTLNLAGMSNLQFLACNNNNITSLNLTGCSSLITIDCSYNQIATLNVSGFAGLTSLTCNENNLTSLDVSGLPILDYLDCDNNQITSLNLEGSPAFTFISCSDNQLETLDLSGNNAEMADCSANNLTLLIIKNGFDDSDDIIQFHDNPGLQYLCVDADELEIYQEILDFYGYTSCGIGTYCSFTPGGDYNTITGTIKFDSDNNGCATGDPMQFIKVHISDGADSGYTFANAAGEYTFYTQAGSFAITPEFENDYFTASPLTATANFPVVDNSVQPHDFCVVPNGVHNDIEVVMVPVIPANPGFEAVYKIVYRNKGNQVLSGTVNCVWDSTEFSTFQLSPPPTIQSQGDYTWNYTNLLPYETREIMMTLQVNTPSDPNPVEVGDILDFTATAALAGDEMPEDNLFVLNQEVIGSFDPNNIVCIEGETATTDAIGEYLHYVVNFENTGTAAATFIVVTNEINPADFDISTLQILNSSHEAAVNIEGNNIEFIFENINLGVMDHGNILFKLKTRPSLMAGDNVTNQANIYFDYNFPVETNDAVTTFGMLTAGHFEADPTVMIYPNPTNDIVNITADNNLRSIELYDIQGRLLETHSVNENSTRVDLSKRATGMYFIKIRTDVGVNVEKIAKK